MTGKRSVGFPQAYIEKCFLAWVRDGRPSNPTRIYDIISTHVNGEKPSPNILRDWMVKYGWTERADALDSMAIEKAEGKFVEERSKFFAKEFEVAIQLQTKGLEYILEKNFDSSASAVQAIRVGSELAFKSAIGGTFVNLPNNVDDLKKKIKDMLERAQENNQIIDIGESIGDITESGTDE